MKKSHKSVRTDELLIDVVEYAFTEWLVRRGIYSAFKANYERAFAPYKSFRDRLRSQIRRSLHTFGLSPSHLITSSFMFSSTPEGVKFWGKQSAAWESFCDELHVEL
nr:MAG TPA: hypothetical protein [Microviridae sp.]